MAQNRHFGDQAEQSTAHMSSRSCPTPPQQQHQQQQHQQQQHQQQQQQGRYDGWSLASAPANLDGSVGLTNATPPAESWVEVASQPSSSSLSSIGDEIVTTGLRVGNSYHRRRRLRASTRPIPRSETAPPAAETSSQEEYDESDSEEDHTLASSAENFQPPSSSEEPGEDSDDVVIDHDDENGDGDDDDDDDDEEEEEDDGDNATALGRASNQPVFQPQPNAFSHPPAPLGQRSYSTNAAMAPHPHNGFTRRSFPGRSQTRVQRGPSFMSPSVREDNDAALRASLTTLLSCAAAARGRPKTKEEAAVQQAPSGHNGVGPSNQPVELLFVPESKLMAEDGDQKQQQQQQEEEEEGMAATPPPQEQAYPPTRSKSKGEDASDKGKRPVPVHRGSRVVRKKKKAAVVSDETLISPTLLTWVVSAGVVVLVSVVGFGAGYVIGREVGRQEGLAASLSSINDTASSGREVMRSSGGSLRRFKWGAVGRSIVAAA